MPDALVACTLFVYWRYMLIEAVNLRIILRSLPAWGVRVEIDGKSVKPLAELRHSPHGECGLKLNLLNGQYHMLFVTPRMGSAG